MEKTYRIVNRSWNFWLGFGWGLIIILIIMQIIDTLPNTYYKSFSDLIFGIIGFAFASMISISNLSAFTYKFVIKNGEVFDKDIFHKERRLDINEIEYIRPRAYKGNTASRYIHGVNPKIESPAFLNKKFEKFPRYRISEDVVKFMHDSYPKVQIDFNYAHLIKSLS